MLHFLRMSIDYRLYSTSQWFGHTFMKLSVMLDDTVPGHIPISSRLISSPEVVGEAV